MITKDDIKDIDLVDATELASTGSSSYRTGNAVTSTTSGTKLVTFPGTVSLIYGDDPVEAGDKIVLVGTTGGADGTYTVNSILSDQTLDVVESIASSTGGSASFKNKSGALRVGVDTATFKYSTSSEVQTALKDMDTKLDDKAYRRHFLLMGG